LQFFIEFRANLTIRVVCALWFVSLMMIGGAGRLLGDAGMAVWNVLVPPEQVEALLRTEPEPAPVDSSPVAKPASLLHPRRMPVGPIHQAWTAPRVDPVEPPGANYAGGGRPN
jgi:hypothetical protein